MKLGIAVVYLFGEENEPLLDAHLGRIARHTTVPYTIYGSVNRLAPEYRERLERRPEVRIVSIPDTELRVGAEHSYYLEHLIQAAIDDGATHVVTLHLDSFPIRTGWAEAIASRLSEDRPLATITPPNTACLFFTRDFYLRYRPTMRLPLSVRETPLLQQYLAEHNAQTHSGVGYGFMAYRHGLECAYLPSTDDGHPPTVFGDLIFHLGRAVFKPHAEGGLHRGGALTALYVRRLLPRWLGLARTVVPKSVRETIKSRWPWLLNTLVLRPLRRRQVQRVDHFLDPGGAEAAPGRERRTAGAGRDP